MPTLAIEDARALVVGCMIATSHSPEDAAIIADHIIDCELRGLTFGGLARVLPVVERLDGISARRRTIEIDHESPVSARLDGGDQVGFLVARRATEIAITKAADHGIAVVGAHNTWYTGMFSYYLEMVTAAGLVGIAAGSSKQVVAPFGGVDARFGTNPIAFGFPSAQGPVIHDAGTSNLMFGEILLHERLGTSLPDGCAFGADGQPTRDPSTALAGSITVWGGHKGSGIAAAVQMLGMLSGAGANPAGVADGGFFLSVFDPAVLMGPRHGYLDEVARYADSIRSVRPIDASHPVRVPFDRSIAQRRESLARGTIEVSADVLRALERIQSRRPAGPATTGDGRS